MHIETFAGRDRQFGVGRIEGAFEIYLGRSVLRFGPPLGGDPGDLPTAAPAEDGLRPVMSGLDVDALRKEGL